MARSSLRSVITAILFGLTISSLPTIAGPEQTESSIVTRASSDARMDRFLSPTKGFIGADAAYSIPIGKSETLWTFGDTWIGEIKNNRRLDSSCIINNSVAKQKDGGPLNFHWRTRTKNRSPESIWQLEPKEEGSYYWPGDGITIDDRLFLVLHKIKNDPQRPPPFQFRCQTDVLARVDNPHDSPANWKIQYVPLANDAEKIQFGTAITYDSAFVYIFCSYGQVKGGLNPHPAILARIARGKLKELDVKAIEYYCKNGKGAAWQSQLQEPIILFKDAAPEMSVTRVEGISGFLAVYMPPMSKEIMVRQATKPEGPWSERALAFTCPEADPILLYSAKTHQELVTEPRQLLITYCRNSPDFESHRSNAAIYFPKCIRINLKKDITWRN